MKMKVYLFGAAVIATGLNIAFSQCYFSETSTNRCSPSIQAFCTNSPACYQEFCHDPYYPTTCSYEDQGARCGGNDCTNIPVATTIDYRTGQCMPADSSHPNPYCVQENPPTFINPWQSKTGPLCDQASLIGKCGACNQ